MVDWFGHVVVAAMKGGQRYIGVDHAVVHELGDLLLQGFGLGNAEFLG